MAVDVLTKSCSKWKKWKVLSSISRSWVGLFNDFGFHAVNVALKSNYQLTDSNKHMTVPWGYPFGKHTDTHWSNDHVGNQFWFSASTMVNWLGICVTFSFSIAIVSAPNWWIVCQISFAKLLQIVSQLVGVHALEDNAASSQYGTHCHHVSCKSTKLLGIVGKVEQYVLEDH